MYSDELNGVRYSQWLNAITSGTRLSAGSPLDPFTTSMRRIKEAALSLLKLADAQRPIHSDEPQRFGDLRRASLIAPESEVLSILGTRVIAAWQKHRAGLAPEPGTSLIQEPDILRNLILINEALSLGVHQYVDYVRRWRKLRSKYPADALIANAWLLHAYSYFDREIKGFNPWDILCNLPITELLPPTTQSANASQQKLDETIQELAKRATGRREFCAAMECHVLGTGSTSREFLLKVRIERGDQGAAQ